MKQLKYIDLFAGIGGFRLALDNIGLKCVFSAENDKHACEMYEDNYGDNPYCDITKLNPKDIPDFDILCAGFPCQAFSICGKQKGFIDDTRGTLFFDIIRILQEKKPRVFILENVKNLTTHDNGNTLRVMLDTLNKIGYTVNYQVLNAKDFKVPQNRERIVLVGNLEGKYFDFTKIKKYKSKPVRDYLDQNGEFEFLEKSEYTMLKKADVKEQKDSGLIFVGYRNKKIRTTGVRLNTEHLSRVHKQPNRIYSSEGTHPTLASQETCGRYWIHHNDKVRKLTLDECYRFMGFPDDFKKIGVKGKLYERIGNSICVHMIEEVGKEVVNQILNIGSERDMKENKPLQFLEELYQKASNMKKIEVLELSEQQLSRVETIVEKEQSNKGVYTALVSSLTYKVLNSSQDVRYHKVELENGYSGRSFDTRYVTPFLKEKRFFGAMKESGWLTRSVEQAHPFTLNFPGKINNAEVKKAFLEMLDDVEVNNASAEKYLLAIFKRSIEEKVRKTVVIINPVDKESNITIENIIGLLHKHFYYKYSTRGASILPVVAFYSIYQCMIKHFDRFKDKELSGLSSHNSCDRSSGETGDIVVKTKNGKLIYEVVEIKFDIKPDAIMVQDAYNKFGAESSIQRYYILSTVHPTLEETKKISELTKSIYEEHGCQIIINGVFESLKYYLRLLTDTDEFLDFYTKNLQNNTELDYEHKIAWNRIIENE